MREIIYTDEQLEKLKKEWENSGSKIIEVKCPNDWCWSKIQNPEFNLNDIYYRFPDDPHWELRNKWIFSDKTLRLEIKAPNSKNWLEIHSASCGWHPDFCYREVEETKETKKQIKSKSKKYAVDILQDAEHILYLRGEENGQNGEERSFQQVADCFLAKTGIKLTAAHICLILQDLKDVRQFAQDRLHKDSIVDCVNYAALKGEELYKQYSSR